MTKSATSEKLEQLLALSNIIPVLTIERAGDGVPLARALVEGGLRLIEITFRTPAAADAARAIVAEVPDAIVGIGTVMTAADLDKAAALGARFALSPGATPDLLKAAAGGGLPFIPGIATASELMLAAQSGFTTCKFFPAVSAGRTAALKALAGPFPHARFCPTGGIGEANIREWLALPNVVAIGGSWIAPDAEVRAGNWTAIAARARRAVGLASGTIST